MADSVPPFFSYSKLLKCTLILTDKCNLACNYCYSTKKNATMGISTAQRIVDFVLTSAQKDERIQIGFFGGEPLLEFDLMKEIIMMIKLHKSFKAGQTSFSITTNGTILNEEITNFFVENNITPNISCDGPPEIQDLNRHFPDGRGTSALVESNIKNAVKLFPLLPVNAVYSPNTLRALPSVVKYLTSIGIRNIFLSANITAKWTQAEANMLPELYDRIGKLYADFYSKGHPIHVNLIDDKIAVIMRGGYTSTERCRMGRGELAFSTSGKIYPCERLVDSSNSAAHCIGDLGGKFSVNRRRRPISSVAMNGECLTCGLREYCVNWCGCANFFATGSYNRIGPFECASEKAALAVASKIIEKTKDTSVFAHHLAGTPLTNITDEAQPK